MKLIDTIIARCETLKGMLANDNQLVIVMALAYSYNYKQDVPKLVNGLGVREEDFEALEDIGFLENRGGYRFKSYRIREVLVVLPAMYLLMTEHIDLHTKIKEIGLARTGATKSLEEIAVKCHQGLVEEAFEEMNKTYTASICASYMFCDDIVDLMSERYGYYPSGLFIQVLAQNKSLWIMDEEMVETMRRVVAGKPDDSLKNDILSALDIITFYMTGENVCAKGTYGHSAVEGVKLTLSGDYAEGVTKFLEAHKKHNTMTSLKFVFGDSILDFYQNYCMAMEKSVRSMTRMEQYEKRYDYYSEIPFSGMLPITFIKHQKEKMEKPNPSYHTTTVADRVFWTLMEEKLGTRELDFRFRREDMPAILQFEMQERLGLTDEERAELRKKFGEVSATENMKKKERWEMTLEGLKSLCSKAAPENAKEAKKEENRIVYCIDEKEFAERDGSRLYITARVQKRTSKGWTKGRVVKMNDPKSLPVDCDETDKAVSTRARKVSYYYEQTDLWVLEIADVLVGCDRVFTMGDSIVSQISVLSEKPYVELTKSKGQILVSSNVTEEELTNCGKYGVIVHKGNMVLNVIKLSETQILTYKALLAQGAFPEEAEGALKAIIPQMANVVEVYSDIVEGASTIETVEGNSAVVLQVRGKGPTFGIAAMCIPLEGGSMCYIPGKGEKTISENRDGKRVQVMRSLSKERKNWQLFEDILDDMEIDLTETEDRRVGEICLHDMLQIVSFAQEHSEEVAIEWPEGEKLTVRGALAPEAISLNIKSSKIGWFDVEGEVRVDETRMLAIGLLLEGLRTSVKGFVRLGENEYMQLSDKLEKQLRKLESIADAGKNGLTVNAFRVGELADALKGEMDVKTDKTYRDLNKKMMEADKMEVSIPANLNADLRDYQTTGFEWMTRRTAWGAGVCLADDMGLGKTLQTIAFLLNKAEEGASLVVAPASVVKNWNREIARFAPTLNVRILNETGDRAKVVEQAGNYDIVITTYGLLVTEEECLSAKKWNTICLDEAHTIKNRGTKMSASAMKLNGEYRVILTGTPIQNHLGELWNLYQFINPGLLGTYEEFQQKFIQPIEANNKSPRQGQLKRIVQPFLLRRTKSEVVEELPDKTEVTRSVELSAEERAAYELYRQRAQNELENGDKINMSILAEITKLREVACSVRLVEKKWKGPESKIGAFMSLVENIVGGGNRVLVFSQFTSFLGMIGKELGKAGMDYCMLDGSTPIKTREKLVEDFQHGKHPIFLISLKAGGLGLNLTAANYVIMLDPWWNPAIEQQATDRAYRIGQKQNVTVYRLIAEGTIEEKILQLHKTKRDLADSLMDGSDMTHQLTVEELRDMLGETRKE